MKCQNTKYWQTKVCFLSLVCIVCTYTFQMRAQESCYGKYLREHNMTVLTAEDADDRYEEQKKAVLAKQMYGDSYQLMVDTITQRAVITKADGTYIADIHATLVDSTWYMWLSVDPLADKYPNNNPYMYCSGNPIMIIDDHGDSTRLWVETTGVGHTWITTGEGDNQTVYSYGRYDDLNKDKDRLRGLTMSGEGVLLQLKGDEAKQYIESKQSTNPICVTIADIKDEQMEEYFDNMFNSSQEVPSKLSSKYYQNPSAHVIDTYHLLFNNCTTKSIQAINAVGSTFFQNNYIPLPNGRGYVITTYKTFISPMGLYLHLKK